MRLRCGYVIITCCFSFFLGLNKAEKSPYAGWKTNSFVEREPSPENEYVFTGGVSRGPSSNKLICQNELKLISVSSLEVNNLDFFFSECIEQ